MIFENKPFLLGLVSLAITILHFVFWSQNHAENTMTHP
jgi:hypothetical protein